MPVSVASSWLSLFVVLWTGSAWFAALHPAVVRRALKLLGFARDAGTGVNRTLDRAIGLVYGAAGLLMLILPRLWE